jgi:5'-3' exonuclease
MGVKGLYTYLKGYRQDLYRENIPDAPRLRIGFDAMSMLYKYKSNYADMYPMLKDMKARGHLILFVFDGKAPQEKEAEVKSRRDVRENATQHATSLKEHLLCADISSKERTILEYSLARLEFQGWHMTRDIRQTFQGALWEMGIPYVKAIGEADNVLTDMASAGKLDVIVSTDMDFLLSGVARLWIPLRNYHGFEESLLKNVLKGEEMTMEMFLDAGILCGVEQLRGRVSVSSHVAFSWIRYYKSIEGLLSGKISERQLDVLRDEGLLAKVRKTFIPGPWEAQIRPDHFERFRTFLEAL